ncbi:MAG TPA: glycosyltransferase [Pseudonocardia sp.]|uniref:glycosyltransferase n=1 Tax=Pseudonocardia sp. TaxID=60912 RepID=UPI002BA05512|nr:glycosyltransferase [Pseudonocardia sp.]
MAQILVITWDGGGNVPPMLGIAGELRRRGHHVRVLGHRQQRDVVAAAGLEFVAYSHTRPWSPEEPATGIRFLLKFLFGVFTNPRIGDDVRSELTRKPVDLAVVDSMTLGALRATERAGLPTAVLMHSLHRYHTHNWSHGPIGIVAALRGMRPGRLWNTADRVLVATDRELDPVGNRLPTNVRYTGVVQTKPHHNAPGETPLVLVSLSTIYFEGQAAALQAILDALAGLPLRAIITTGAVEPRTLTAPPGVELHRYIPHEEIMPSASLVIGHGGHSTTMRALAHDLPLLILPMHPMLDQPMIGKAVAAAGAGRVLPRTARPDEIRKALNALLQDEQYRAAAATIGNRLRSRNGANIAADELECLLSTQEKAAGPAV